VPWLPTPPPRPSPTLIALAPPCAARQLHGRLGVQGAGGALVGGIVLRNTSAAACSLRGRPVARLVGAAAVETSWEEIPKKPQRFGRGTIAPRPASLRALQPGSQAWVALSWANWCPPGTTFTGTGPPPKTLVLELRGGGELRFGLRGREPRCDAPRFPSGLGIAPFRPNGHEPARSTRIPLRTAFDGISNPEAKFETPAPQVAPGGVLRYRIALTNRSNKPYAFPACPVYVERVFTARFRQSYVLNCKEAGTFAPGERKVFAMELHVPVDATPGRQSLTWVLGPKTYDHPWAPATILITS
jgi:Protein of unknown function (DUF4232)